MFWAFFVLCAPDKPRVDPCATSSAITFRSKPTTHFSGNSIIRASRNNLEWRLPSVVCRSPPNEQKDSTRPHPKVVSAHSEVLYGFVKSLRAFHSTAFPERGRFHRAPMCAAFWLRKEVVNCLLFVSRAVIAFFFLFLPFTLLLRLQPWKNEKAVSISPWALEASRDLSQS